MTSPELSKIIISKYLDEKGKGNSTGAAKLEDFWNEFTNSKLLDTSNVDRWIKSNTDKIRNLGLDKESYQDGEITYDKNNPDHRLLDKFSGKFGIKWNGGK